jgi:muramoyltetrapeptide carboxypeptidase
MLPVVGPGSVIRIIAPARKVSPSEIEPAVEILQQQGYDVRPGRYLYESYHQFAGTDSQRLDDFQQALDDEEASAILFARGGYGTVRLIDKLNFSKFLDHPKWLIGFSDLTVIHSHVGKNFKLPTLHAPMAINLPNISQMALTCFWGALQGHVYEIQFPAHELNRSGKVTGKITGGNLSVLYSLLGSASDISTKGKILFIEDLDEYLYHVDRMMMALKRAGKLSGLKALIVGAMTDMKDNVVPFGLTAEEIIRQVVDEYDYPVCFGFPAGHIENNMPVLLGSNATLDMGPDDCQLSFH